MPNAKQLGLISINHRTARVDLREKVSILDSALQEALHVLQENDRTGEYVVLSTCNRTELYSAHVDHADSNIERLAYFLTKHSGLTSTELRSASMRCEGDQVVHHLFRVCAGLESMVPGEPQIMGQVRRAYAIATNTGAVGPVLHQLFQEALRSARKIRSSSGLDARRLSIGTVVVQIARQVFTDLTDKTVVGVGAGAMAKATLSYLLKEIPEHVWVVNRSIDGAQTLSRQLRLSDYRGGPRPIDEIESLIGRADIVVSSTGSGQPMISNDRFGPLLGCRSGRPLLLIDIAVPRDVDARIGDLPDVYLYNIDDLQAKVDSTSLALLRWCDTQTRIAAKACVLQLASNDLGQVAQQLSSLLHQFADAEQLRTNRKIAALTEPDPASLQRLMAEHTDRLINKILHLPLSQLDRRRFNGVASSNAAAIRRLFQLEEQEK